jgi:hypothetical protein
MRLQHTKLAAANLSTDDPARVAAKAVIVAEVERLHWRIWNGKTQHQADPQGHACLQPLLKQHDPRNVWTVPSTGKRFMTQ